MEADYQRRIVEYLVRQLAANLITKLELGYSVARAREILETELGTLEDMGNNAVNFVKCVAGSNPGAGHVEVIEACLPHYFAWDIPELTVIPQEIGD